MCVLYKLFVPKGSGHNSFDICEWTEHTSAYRMLCIQAIHTRNRTTFSSRPFRRIARWNKIELSFGDFHSMCRCPLQRKYSRLRFMHESMFLGNGNENEVKSWVRIVLWSLDMYMLNRINHRLFIIHPKRPAIRTSRIHNASFHVCSHFEQDVVIYTVNTKIRFTTS